MRNLVLIKFEDKHQLRLLLRYNYKIFTNYSSLYKVDEVYYILLQSAMELIVPASLKVIPLIKFGSTNVKKVATVEDYKIIG